MTAVLAFTIRSSPQPVERRPNLDCRRCCNESPTFRICKNHDRMKTISFLHQLLLRRQRRGRNLALWPPARSSCCWRRFPAAPSTARPWRSRTCRARIMSAPRIANNATTRSAATSRPPTMRGSSPRAKMDSTPAANPATARAACMRIRAAMSNRLTASPPAGRSRQALSGRFPVEPARAIENACYQCHMDVRGQFNLPSHHPVPEGRMTCIQCHPPHKGIAFAGGSTQLLSQEENCVAMPSRPAGTVCVRARGAARRLHHLPFAARQRQRQAAHRARREPVSQMPFPAGPRAARS